MTKKATPTVKDSLSTFTASTAESIMTSGFGSYRDAPLPMPALNGYLDFYRTSWICRAAVDGIPEDCFKRGYQWVAEAQQVSLLEALERRLSIQHKKQQALSFSRLDGEAYLYIDTGDIASGELTPDRVGRDGLRFVNVFRKSDLKKGPLIKDPISQYYKQPEYYEINSIRIHPSRVIRFVNSPDPETGDGVSVLTYMLAPIIATETARDNVVALTTEACMDILSVEGLMDAVSDPETEALAVRRYSLFRQMKRTNAMGVIDKDKEEYSKHFPSFSTLPEVVETMRRETAAAIGKPYALLFGNSGGIGNNGSTEIQNYYDDISTVQRNTIQPICSVLDEVVIRSALGSRPEEIYIEWASLWEMSDKEKADVASQSATAAKTAVDAGIVPADVLTEALINSWVEIGAFQGIEQGYQDWINAGGELESDTADVVNGNSDDNTSSE